MKKKEILKEQKRIKAAQKERAFDFSEASDVKKLLYISGGVIIFIVVVFIMTNILNGTWDLFSRDNEGPVEIDTALVMCGTIFSKTDKEYLVMAYNIKNDEDSVYSALFEGYSGKLPIYYLDLESGFNKGCIGEKNNFVNNSEKIKFASQTLLYIKDGKIIKSYTTKEQIKSFLTKEK